MESKGSSGAALEAPSPALELVALALPMLPPAILPPARPQIDSGTPRYTHESSSATGTLHYHRSELTAATTSSVLGASAGGEPDCHDQALHRGPPAPSPPPSQGMVGAAPDGLSARVASLAVLPTARMDSQGGVEVTVHMLH